MVRGFFRTKKRSELWVRFGWKHQCRFSQCLFMVGQSCFATNCPVTSAVYLPFTYPSSHCSLRRSPLHQTDWPFRLPIPQDFINSRLINFTELVWQDGLIVNICQCLLRTVYRTCGIFSLNPFHKITSFPYECCLNQMKGLEKDKQILIHSKKLKFNLLNREI